ncbi:hypothetical protein GGI12_005673, partial [Dipsacomyces acuminosporus]
MNNRPPMMSKAFTVESGEVAFGKQSSVIYGAEHSPAYDQMDRSKEADDENDGKPAAWRVFNFKCTAKTGVWKARKIVMDSPAEGILGYILYHESIDPEEIALKCTKVGYDFPDPEGKIIHVNRGYWDVEVSDEDVEKYFAGDHDALWEPTVSFFDRRYMFNPSHGAQIPVPDMGDLIGYLAFSGDKHERIADSDELVAFVFDKDTMMERCIEDDDIEVHTEELAGNELN